MKMKITQYGYPGDRNGDTDTREGRGAYHPLEKGVSCALTDSAREALGAARHSWVKISFDSGGSQVRRLDDRAPEEEKRCDLYNPGGFESSLEDFANVELTTPPAVH